MRMYLSDSGNGKPLTSTGRRAQACPLPRYKRQDGSLCLLGCDSR